jgi:adenine-specific DNA-methyltransferase
MAKKTTKKTVETLKHEKASRKNIPTAEFQSVLRKDEQSPIRIAYERRNRDLDPQLVWRGKDEQDWSDLVVHAPPLYIQEKIHPKVLIDDLMRRTEAANKATEPQFDLFADFNGPPNEGARTEFYQHEANWTNRMILGDSLQVMASLAEREGLRGKVQCIYIDPPYGIKFNSNFQWSTTSRDVKDGNAEHITREPEQVKAFRDTWRDGIHSYLTYLRDRLTVARDLLAESGSIFVQIGDENVHRVRAVMDEVFGEDNFISVVVYAKTTGFSGSYLSSVTDHIVWYARYAERLKFRAFYSLKQAGDEGASKYRIASTINALRNSTFDMSRLATSDQLTSQGASVNSEQKFGFMGKSWTPPAGLHWKTTVHGLERLAKAARIIEEGNSIRYVRCLDDFPIVPQTNVWLDIGGVQSRTDPKIYVVQTATEAVKRCILMTTDPGDLVLDPTCGSGTTAYVAEQWGRRWITIDTSRVALALARARIMGARYLYYLLADSSEGQLKEAEVTHGTPSNQPTRGDIRQGFVYERVPHITLKSIANNPVLKARMNADLHMADDLKNTGKGNLFVIFGEPDVDILDTKDGKIQVKINGVDVFHPNTGEVRSDGAEGIACWFIDTDYNEEGFFVRHGYFLGASDPYKSLKTTLKAEINEEAWDTLYSDTSRPFDKPKSGRIAVKVINHLGDEVMKVFKVR